MPDRSSNRMSSESVTPTTCQRSCARAPRSSEPSCPAPFSGTARTGSFATPTPPSYSERRATATSGAFRNGTAGRHGQRGSSAPPGTTMQVTCPFEPRMRARHRPTPDWPCGCGSFSYFRAGALTPPAPTPKRRRRPGRLQSPAPPARPRRPRTDVAGATSSDARRPTARAR